MIDIRRPRRRRSATEINARLWQGKRGPGRFARRELYPAEVVLLARHAPAIAGRVLEIGCGGGRILGYLVSLSREAHGIDVSEAMLAYCRTAYPAAQVRRGDLRRLGDAVAGRFDAILALDNVLDVVSDAERRAALGQMRELLSGEGRLLFSSHNLGAVSGSRPAAALGAAGSLAIALRTPLGSVPRTLARLLPRLWNRRRLRPLETRASEYAVLNDSESDFGVLHYYIDRDHQRRQLEALGWELLECLDHEGNPVAAGQASSSPWLFYAARLAQAGQ